MSVEVAAFKAKMVTAQRKPVPSAKDNTKSKPVPEKSTQTPSTGLSLNVALALASLAAAGWLYYSGAFTTTALPNIYKAKFEHESSKAKSSPPSSLFPSEASKPGSPVQPSEAQHTDLTDAEIRAYDGSDPSTPLYLAINGTIYDVSAGRNFYGPGGHYGHFAGRDATRAWVTECWDTEDQLTHDMRRIEEMFMPKYMDEEFADVAEGKQIGDGAVEGMREKAAEVLKKVGKPSKKERARRREADLPEAMEKAEQALGKWVGFFAKGGKYPVVGKMIREDGWEESAPKPPELCDAARKKKPVRGGGKLDALMNMPMKMGGDAGVL